MKLMIEIDEKRFEEIKQIANAQSELTEKTEAQIIANGTPITDDCISREALKKVICDTDFDFGDYYDNTEIIRERACEIIDNTPTIGGKDNDK